MAEFSKHRSNMQRQNDEQRIARERMAYFPISKVEGDVEVLHVHKDMWVVSPYKLFAT